jgi:hypothetical protein
MWTSVESWMDFGAGQKKRQVHFCDHPVVVFTRKEIFYLRFTIECAQSQFMVNQVITSVALTPPYSKSLTLPAEEKATSYH